MSRGRRSSGAGHEEQHANDERWMASYMDMVTVLMCTFIVLFSMSSIDAHKFNELKNSLQTGFGLVKSQKIDTAKGVIVPAKDVNVAQNGSTAAPAPSPSAPDATATAEPSASTGPLAQAEQEVADLKKVEDAINAKLTAEHLQTNVSYTIDQRGLTIGLIGGNTFFDTNAAVLTPAALATIDAIGPVLVPTPYTMSIEGHADTRIPDAPYATNWDLAAARAIAVLRRLTDQSGIPAQRIYAVSDGSADATATADPGQLAQDRRVDIVVRSSKDEAVRNLIPQVVAGGSGNQ